MTILQVNDMSPKALIVDNDFFFSEFLAGLLEKRNFEVETAYDGKEGISKLDSFTPDILFTELIMPKIDGEIFIRYINDRYPDNPFPVVLMSNTLVERMDEYSSIGADYYIAKGPTDLMEDYFNNFLDKVERQPFPARGEEYFEPEKVFPRQATALFFDILEFLQGIDESLGIGVIVVDRDARVISSNNRANMIVNKTLKDILNRPVTALFPGNEKDNLISALKTAVKNRDIPSVKLLMPDRDKTLKVLVSLLTVSGDVKGWVLALDYID